MKRKKIVFYFLILLDVTLFSCNSNNPENKSINSIEQHTANTISTDSSILNIYVNKDGKVSVNQKEISLAGLDKYIDSVKLKIKAIHYSRYNAREYEGPKESLLVLDIIIKYSFPITFYTDSTFNQVANIN